MRTIEERIDIAAPPERVWEVLADFDSFPAWNPFIREARGTLAPGERIEVRLQPPDGRGMTFRPTILRAEPGRELRWLGRLGLPRIFDGEHFFLLEPRDDTGAELVQGEHFRGVLVPLLGGAIEDARRGFVEMNRALKQRVESRG